MYLRKLKIGNVELNNNIILGPMAGLTDRPFRIVCEKYNPGLVVTEMVSSKALFYNDNKTKTLLNVEGEKKPISIQIFGNDEEAMSYATKYICEKRIADIIDINMGCPAPKVTKNGEGSKLMLDPDKVESIVKAVVESSSVPVSVKIRKGWDNDHINAVEVAKRIEKAGAKMITVHGRTRSEFYSGKSDLEIIKKVKEAVSIPVIGNGDVKTAEDAIKMFDETNCDGIMISRGSLGNPWIFGEIREKLSKVDELKKENLSEAGAKESKNEIDRILNEDFIIKNDEKLKTILKHIDLETEEKGEITGVREMRKHLAYYIKGEKNASEMRDKINYTDNKEELEKMLIEYFKEL